MADKLMYIPNKDTQKYPLVVEKFGHLTKGSNQSKVPKVVKPTNVETSVIFSPMSTFHPAYKIAKNQ